jgi:hypothetical protein
VSGTEAEGGGRHHDRGLKFQIAVTNVPKLVDLCAYCTLIFATAVARVLKAFEGSEPTF